MNSDNDIYSENFQSQMDVYFTSGYIEGSQVKYSRWDKDGARSALATTRPRHSSRHWGNAPLGMRMVRK